LSIPVSPAVGGYNGNHAAGMVPAATVTAGRGVAFTMAMDHVAQAFEALGAAVLVVGAVWSFILAVLVWRRTGKPGRGYASLRRAFGGTLLLGL
jgi:hypothetical protein